jgi:hypothetical protein
MGLLAFSTKSYTNNLHLTLLLSRSIVLLMPFIEANKDPPYTEGALTTVENELYPLEMAKGFIRFREARTALKKELRARGELVGGKLTNEQIHNLMVECGLITEKPDQAESSTSLLTENIKTL